ncbi:9092_t:CDS:2, partial [Racocetra persica]
IKNVNINDRFQFPILYRVVNGKCMELQDQGYGETDKSKGLTKEEIHQILLYLNSGDQTAMRLTQKAFFWNAYLLGLCGGHEKNNQGGLQGQNKYRKFSSQHIHIPADLPNNEFKPIQNLQSYVNLRPADA